MTRIQRLTRALGLDANPLRRGADRLETTVVFGLSALFLIGAPLLAVTAGQRIHQAGLAQQRAERGWHQVSAAALQSAPSTDAYSSQWADLGVLASWVAPSGIQRIGEVPASAGIKAGQSIRVWVNGSGWLSGPPLSARQLSIRVIAVAALMPAVLAVVLLAIGSLARWLLNRSKLAAWEADWALVEPQWTKQR